MDYDICQLSPKESLLLNNWFLEQNTEVAEAKVNWNKKPKSLVSLDTSK